MFRESWVLSLASWTSVAASVAKCVPSTFWSQTTCMVHGASYLASYIGHGQEKVAFRLRGMKTGQAYNSCVFKVVFTDVTDWNPWRPHSGNCKRASAQASEQVSESASLPASPPASQQANQLASQPAGQPASQPASQPARQPASPSAWQAGRQPSSQQANKRVSEPCSALPRNATQRNATQSLTQSHATPAQRKEN